MCVYVRLYPQCPAMGQDPKIWGLIAIIKYNFKDTKIIHDEKNSKLALLETRYNGSSIEGILSDIYHLSKCEYVVCTLSSGLVV